MVPSSSNKDPADSARRHPTTLPTKILLLSLLSSEISASATATAATTSTNHHAGDDNNPCLLYLAKSTIPGAGLGMFAGTSFSAGQLIGRNVGDAAFPTTDQDWHNSDPSNMISKYTGDYHWPLTNYDWNAPDIGMQHEAEDVSATVTGFGAAPNCHFRLLNVEEGAAEYDAAGLDRYTSPGAGGSSPWFNRTSVAARDIVEGSELFVDYGQSWFLTRDGVFELVPVQESYERAQKFLGKYAKMLLGIERSHEIEEEDEEEEEEEEEEDARNYNIQDLLDQNKLILGEEAQVDLWDLIKTFPYPTRERQALPATPKDAIRAALGDIMTVEEENSIRDMEYLKEHGKCVDNIVPGLSTIPHAGRGAFATRFIPKGGLVSPVPLVHIADKTTTYMYAEMIGPNGNIVRNTSAIVGKQIIFNYCFGHPNSTLLLFPYSSNVAYVNHHLTEYNAEIRWATDFDFFHKREWLNKSVDFLEKEWTAGLALEFIATRDIQPGEEVFINYGEEWQRAWDEHVKNWMPPSKEADFNNLTLFTDVVEDSTRGRAGYARAEDFNDDVESPIRTVTEQKTIPYPFSVEMICQVKLGHTEPYYSAPLTAPFFKREWDEDEDAQTPETFEKCDVIKRFVKDEDDYDPDESEGGDHEYYYTVRIEGAAKRILEYDNYLALETHVITDVPWRAIRFKNIEYTSDVFLKNAFRHEMILPDDIFPRAWMNLIPKEERNG